jgi:outer membrane phospholipase A
MNVLECTDVAYVAYEMTTPNFTFYNYSYNYSTKIECRLQISYATPATSTKLSLAIK